MFTAEVALRCNAQIPCPVTLALWGLGINGDEPAARNITVPLGGWSVYGLIAQGYAPHSKLRFEVYNGTFGQNLDVDFATPHWSDNRSP
ncbi:MAG: hypothetical protein AB1673_06745 [Actinomycetota bacterium]